MMNHCIRKQLTEFFKTKYNDDIVSFEKKTRF